MPPPHDGDLSTATLLSPLHSVAFLSSSPHHRRLSPFPLHRPSRPPKLSVSSSVRQWDRHHRRRHRYPPPPHQHHHRQCFHPQMTTQHPSKPKLSFRAENPRLSDRIHPATTSTITIATSSSSEGFDMKLDEDEASSLQCFGTGSDVECVSVPNYKDDIVRADIDAAVNRDDADADDRMPLASDIGKFTPLSDQKSVSSGDVECIGTGTDVECVIVERKENEVDKSGSSSVFEVSRGSESVSLLDGKRKDLTSSSSAVASESLSSVPDWLKGTWENMVLISPFFFWGTAMVAMKGVLPKAGPMFVASTRLIPSGLLLIGFAAFQNRKQPSGLNAWFAVALFALVDAACFQGFLAEGLKRTSAGLGSVIIDSQPLTVAILASIFFGEAIGASGFLGLATGVLGLLLLEVPPQVIGEIFKGHSEVLSAPPASENGWNLWDSGEWWMLLAAQSMAVGTVMVRWICQFADPVMATGWHMVIGGIPLLGLAIIQHDPALSGHIQDLDPSDWLALIYVSVFGSAVSYGVFFYNASRGSLTKLSSLTFLTPMFAALFGYLLLDETLNPVQIVGAIVTLASIYLINKRPISNNDSEAKT